MIKMKLKEIEIFIKKMVQKNLKEDSSSSVIKNFLKNNHLSKQALPKNIYKYKVTAQAYYRNNLEVLSPPKDEIIDIQKNQLFNGKFGSWKKVESLWDIADAYQAFWNDMNKTSPEIVKVIDIKPVKSK
jgi:hypothetical protein